MYELKIKDGEVKGFKTAQGKKFTADVRKMFEDDLKKNKPQEYEITIVSNGKQQARIRVLGTICVKTAVKPEGHSRKECRTLPSGLQWCP
jgi:hypothetical protein